MSRQFTRIAQFGVLLWLGTLCGSVMAQEASRPTTVLDWRAPGFVLNSQWAPTRLVEILARTRPQRPQKVYVTGVLSVEFEDEALYLSVDHYQRAIIDNAVQLDIPKELAELLRPLQGKYVTVFGTLRSTRASQYRTAFMISRIERIVSAGVGGGGR